MNRRSTRALRVVAAGALSAGVLLVAGASSPATAARPIAVAVAPPLPAGARLVAPLASTTTVHLDVVLRVRDAAGLRSLLAGLYDRRSPLFHRFLPRGAFADRFGATTATLHDVEVWLREQGLETTGTAANRLVVHAAGPASSVERALGTTLDVVESGRRTLGFVNTRTASLPAAVSGEVAGVVGLDSLPAVRTGLVRRAPVADRVGTARTERSTPLQACSQAADLAKEEGTFTAAGISTYYAMTPLHDQLGDLGQGVHVAIAEFEPNEPSDVAAFQHCYGTSATVTYVPVDAGAGSGPGSGEATLDIDNVLSIAPRASLDVYQAPNTDLGGEDMYGDIVTTDTDKVVTTSWGSCEPDTDSPLIAAEATTFAEANTQGQVVFAASGDDGSTDCFGDGNDATASTLAVDDPGSQAYVLSVGGTTAAPSGEAVWNDGSGAGGGGISTLHCMPAYQDVPAIAGIVNADTTTDPTTCPTSPSFLREVPDVAAIADPNTGYTSYYDGSWGGIGGTSGSAPLWAGIAAVVLASPYCTADHATVGLTPQSLYELAASPQAAASLHDVTSGDNAFSDSGYAGSLYPATAGFDQASGLGTPRVLERSGSTVSLFVPGLAASICFQQRTVTPTPVVSRIVPDDVASTRSTTATLVGSGFLPIDGAVRVVVGGRSLTPTCTSSTRCTVVLPGLTPGTRGVEVEDQTFTHSAASATVTFVAAPRVTSLSPRRGPTSGGTKVVVHGTGFTGRVTVKFGTHEVGVQVVSSTELIVVAPRGRGTVHVVVTATGGSSAATAANAYTY